MPIIREQLLKILNDEGFQKYIRHCQQPNGYIDKNGAREEDIVIEEWTNEEVANFIIREIDNESFEEFQSHFSPDQELACREFFHPDFEQVAKKGGIEGKERKNKYKDYILIIAIALVVIAFWLFGIGLLLGM